MEPMGRIMVGKGGRSGLGRGQSSLTHLHDAASRRDAERGPQGSFDEGTCGSLNRLVLASGSKAAICTILVGFWRIKTMHVQTCLVRTCPVFCTLVWHVYGLFTSPMRAILVPKFQGLSMDHIPASWDPLPDRPAKCPALMQRHIEIEHPRLVRLAVVEGSAFRVQSLTYCRLRIRTTSSITRAMFCTACRSTGQFESWPSNAPSKYGSLWNSTNFLFESNSAPSRRRWKKPEG